MKKLFTLFLLLLPLNGLKIFHTRIISLILVLFVFVFLLYSLIVNKESLKTFKYLLIYYIAVVVFFLVSYIKSFYFNSLIINDFNIVFEITTYLKLIIPFTLLFILKYIKLTDKEYKVIFKTWIIFICGLIIVTNIYKISYSSYNDNNITYNIFEWYKNPYYVLSSSKGLFMYANQVACILTILLPLMVKYLLESKKNILYIFMIFISSIMLGTRVSTLGGLLVLIFIFLFYLLICIYKKNKINKNILLIIMPIILWMCILPFTPFYNRNKELNTYMVTDNNELLYENKKIESLDPKIQFVYQNVNENYIPKMFFEEKYPISKDTDFWYTFVSDNKDLPVSYRFIERSIIKRIVKINNNKLDYLFGISNSRVQNIVNIENDFLLHYYSFGIIGTIILLLIYFYLSIKNIKEFLIKQEFNSFISLTTVLLFIFISVLTGNIINSLFTSMSFIIIYSYFNR